MVEEGKTLADSILHCQSLGREMVSILSQEDANHFATITLDMDNSVCEHGYIRVGLHAANADCQWSWVNSTARFDPGSWFWKSSEPNGCTRTELCAMTGKGQNQWNDSKCWYKACFVCGNIKSGKI